MLAKIGVFVERPVHSVLVADFFMRRVSDKFYERQQVCRFAVDDIRLYVISAPVSKHDGLVKIVESEPEGLVKINIA